eukprot:CCRYP_021035-RA/>CCRYP_021035-RA protein AED:0.38 eAED:0.38 QI:0/0/0/1/0/0.25/4/0/584
MHHTIPAERAIRTWKNHFVAIRAGTPSTYRLSNWCKDLEQTDITLNMMQPCTQNPKLSAHKAMEGMFSFDATPMAPISTECMVHVKPSCQQTWGYHAFKAWYFAPALNHYCCIRVVTNTGAMQTTDTFTFLHHPIPVPTITAADCIIRATKRLKQAIDGHTTPAPDELEAIAALKALITGSPPDPPLPDPAVEPSPQLVTTNHAYAPMQTPTFPTTARKALEYRDLIKLDAQKDLWTTSYANKLGRLTQGIRDIPGTNTMFFIHKTKVPKDRQKDITYGRILVALRSQRTEPAHTRLTVGGNLIDYPCEVATPPTSDLTTAKLLFNSVISTPGAVFVVMDIKNFYLNTPMECPEFMHLPLKLIPTEIIDTYNLREKADDKGWVYVHIELGMYGLPQAGLLANKLLAKILNLVGYYHCQYTRGLWRHVWHPITFSLVVDDFGIKTVGLTHAKHLKQALEQYYEVGVDWKGQLYCGLHLDWDYKHRAVHLSMPNYISKALTRFQHLPPLQPEHSPYQASPIQYGNTVQLAKTPYHKNWNYCWSCGYNIADDHTSATCPYPQQGHVYHATHTNICNGCQKNKYKMQM